MSDHLVLDPAPEEWMTDDRKSRLIEDFASSIQLLEDAEVLDEVLSYWIRREICSSDSSQSSCLEWARAQWGHRLQSLFLQHKNNLDQASYRFIRVPQQGLALEIYHRLLAKEESFEELSIKFGTGSERFHGGLVTLQPLGKLPSSFAKFIRKLKPGNISKPLALGQEFAVVQLQELIPAVQGEIVDQQLLSQELQQWVDGMQAHLKGQLRSSNA